MCERITRQLLLDRNDGYCGFCATEIDYQDAHERHAELERADPRPELARGRSELPARSHGR